MSLVRENLLTIKGYTPYCGAETCRGMYPRTVFHHGQFHCNSCGWRSNFEPEFITAYLLEQDKLFSDDKLAKMRDPGGSGCKVHVGAFCGCGAMS